MDRDLDSGGAGGLPKRKRSYHTTLLDADYFLVRPLGCFVRRAIGERVRTGMRVADVGCGEQPWRGMIAACGAEYVGIDVTQNAMGTVDLVAPITQVPLPDASFDVILCTEVLEHVSDSRGALGELRRLCVPGGVVVVTTPFTYPLHEEPFDFVRLTPHQIRTLGEAVGLEVALLQLVGNEIEGMAVLWNNLWSRSIPRRLGILRALLLGVTRLPANLVTAVLSAAVGNLLARKSFLAVVAILRRPQ